MDRQAYREMIKSEWEIKRSMNSNGRGNAEKIERQVNWQQSHEKGQQQPQQSKGFTRNINASSTILTDENQAPPPQQWSMFESFSAEKSPGSGFSSSHRGGKHCELTWTERENDVLREKNDGNVFTIPSSKSSQGGETDQLFAKRAEALQEEVCQLRRNLQEASREISRQNEVIRQSNASGCSDLEQQDSKRIGSVQLDSLFTKLRSIDVHTEQIFARKLEKERAEKEELIEKNLILVQELHQAETSLSACREKLIAAESFRDKSIKQSADRYQLELDEMRQYTAGERGEHKSQLQQLASDMEIISKDRISEAKHAASVQLELTRQVEELREGYTDVVNANAILNIECERLLKELAKSKELFHACQKSARSIEQQSQQLVAENSELGKKIQSLTSQLDGRRKEQLLLEASRQIEQSRQRKEEDDCSRLLAEFEVRDQRIQELEESTDSMAEQLRFAETELKREKIIAEECRSQMMALKRGLSEKEENGSQLMAATVERYEEKLAQLSREGSEEIARITREYEGRIEEERLENERRVNEMMEMQDSKMITAIQSERNITEKKEAIQSHRMEDLLKQVERNATTIHQFESRAVSLERSLKDIEGKHRSVLEDWRNADAQVRAKDAEINGLKSKLKKIEQHSMLQLNELKEQIDQGYSQLMSRSQSDEHDRLRERLEGEILAFKKRVRELEKDKATLSVESEMLATNLLSKNKEIESLYTRLKQAQ